MYVVGGAVSVTVVVAMLKALPLEALEVICTLVSQIKTKGTQRKQDERR